MMRCQATLVPPSLIDRVTLRDPFQVACDVPQAVLLWQAGTQEELKDFYSQLSKTKSDDSTPQKATASPEPEPERLGQLIETTKAEAQRQAKPAKQANADDDVSEDSTPSTPTEQSPHEATEALHRVLVEETAAAVELHVGEAQVRDAHAKKLEVRSRLCLIWLRALSSAVVC